MQNKPLVTIVTITRNLIKEGRKDFFRQCVDSVKMQDYSHIEHVIVDGASDDGTLDLFNELGLEYISEPDTGIYNAFNKGVKRANGKYIAFLNSDDYYIIPNAVTLVVDALEKSNADFTYAPVSIVNERGEETSVW